MQSLPPFLFFFFFLLLLLSYFLSPSLSSHVSDDVEFWCSNTPHPEPCRYYLARNPYLGAPKDKAQFYKLSLRLALDLTLRAQSHLKRRGPACRRSPEKTAWLDCWKLYANTVLQLNRTLAPPPGAGCTAFDSQTWLSAALTNIQTCPKGFRETRTTSELIGPVVRYNVSDLVSNCLAINRPAAADAYRGRFSSWTTFGNRRLLQLSAAADLVVAKDGSGNFRTIKEALDAASKRMQGRRGSKFVILIKAGSQQLEQSRHGRRRHREDDYYRKQEPSGITFRNTFGPGSQAVALLSASDRSVFYRCSIEGYQDTLFVYTQRQFYRECDIYGTIDFIFGNAAAVLQRCNIYARRPRHGESNVITAQGRSDPNQNTGIVIQSSNIKPAAELLPVRRTVRSYLGRPWMQYSRTLYLQNYIDSIIDHAGWLPFRGSFALSTLYYAEFENTGPGARMSRRVKWPGYHVIRRPSIVRPFTVGRFIAGGSWIPSTGVPFNPSL
ncbi:hypothetical protein C4D60_Mb05t04420 [Musa balbisiana]|uniref:Pectinesterase n=1 Tax=Musa balbisiana TaxID=52838 RepID=A0A4S8JTM9_MUSBA|nr:hypothetical protein C4D60_Mb05t04420 [Musa balbisiana]